MTPHLSPMEPALGPQPLNSNFYVPNQVTLAMKEKVFSLSGDDFTVKTADGVPVCKCKGKVLSVRDKKKFTDMDDNELFVLSNKMLSIHKSFHGESPQGYDFEVKGHFKLIGSKSTVTFKNASDGQNVELELKGDWIDKSAEITCGGRPVAHISRGFFNAREFFGDKQTFAMPLHRNQDPMRSEDCKFKTADNSQYFVTVAANVDLSLIAAIAVALDERENEES